MSFISRFFRPKRRGPEYVIPVDWMPIFASPGGIIRRITVHWTAGSHIASALDCEHYHYLIEGSGKIVRGNFTPLNNLPPLREGAYAAHTRSANSRNIGIALCAMHGATESPYEAGEYPINQMQWLQLTKLLATLCHRYDIAVTDQSVLTHAEVQNNLGIWQRGKWDIAYLPFEKPVFGAKNIGDMMRSEVVSVL